MSAWIEMVSDTDASEELQSALQMARTPHGTVDNVMRVHSLRPATLRGHVTLYKAVLHDDNNTLPAWLQETVSSYVSILNNCEYSLANHWANARHLINDDQRADTIFQALQTDQPQLVFDGAELTLMQYTRKLTLTPGSMSSGDVLAMRKAGLEDGVILEINQIIGYFNYVNRLLNGLGVTTEGDTVGYYACSTQV